MFIYPVPTALYLHLRMSTYLTVHVRVCQLLRTGPRLINMTDFRSSLASTPPGAILTSFARSAEVCVWGCQLTDYWCALAFQLRWHSL